MQSKEFPVVPYENCTFLTKFFFKNWKFPNKKGTFDVNLVFTAIAFFKDSSVVGQNCQRAHFPCPHPPPPKNALFTTTLACTKGTFHHKKGTFSPLKEIGGGGARATRAPPPIPTPLASIIVAPAAPKRKIAHRQ